LNNNNKVQRSRKQYQYTGRVRKDNPFNFCS